MKKFGKLTVLTMAVLCMAVVICSSVYAVTLKDIDRHWAKSYIEYGVEKGYISGYADGTFLPDKAVTRAEFSKMINNAIGLSTSGSARGDFTDVDTDEWYFNEVKKAEYAGYITGYEDGSFKPSNKITRQEAAVILSRIVIPTEERVKTTAFADGNTIDTWASDAVSMISAKGYIKGDENGKFLPKGALTRSQAAKLICEVVTNEKVKNGDVVAESKGNEDEVVISELLLTDDVVINVEKGTSVVFKNCRVLGTVVIKSENATVDFENSAAKEVSFEKEVATLTLDKGSSVNASNLLTPATLIGDGFKNVYIEGRDLAAGIITLKGSAGTVEVNSDALINVSEVGKLNVNKKVTLSIQSGTIKDLTVLSAAKGSTINLMSSKVDVEKATNKAAVSYTGSGTIEKSQNDVEGVSYGTVTVEETTGKRAEGTSGVTSKFFDNATFSPSKGKTNVATTTRITIRFDSKIYTKNGKTIDSDYLEENIELHRTSATGNVTGFSGSISSQKTTITLDPTSDLRGSTKYYVVIPKGVFTNEDGDENDEYTTYFTTGASDANVNENTDSDVTITFLPDSGDKAPITTDIVVQFSDKVYRGTGKKTLTSDYCESSVFEIRKNSASGSTVSFTANVDSGYKKVTLIPEEPLEPKTKYYVIVKNRLYDSNGSLVGSDQSYFTTEGGLPVVITPADGASNISVKPEIFIEFSEKVLNYNGKELTANDLLGGGIDVRTSKTGGTSASFDIKLISNKKIQVVITKDLTPGTTYYVILKKGVVLGAISNQENEEVISKFVVAGETTPMITPVDGERNVGVKDKIRISFTKPVYTVGSVLKNLKLEGYPDSVTIPVFEDYIIKSGAIELRRNSASGSGVAFGISFEDEGKTIVVTPNSDLGLNMDFFVIVKGSMFTDEKGSSRNKSASTSFSTNETLLPAFNPTRDTRNVKVDGTFRIEFYETVYDATSEDDEDDTLTKRDVVTKVVKLYPEDDANKEIDFTADVSSGRTISITPLKDLESGTWYILEVVEKSVINRNGDLNQRSYTRFRTESNVVKTVTYAPAANETKVDIGTDIVIEFASPIYKKNLDDIDEEYIFENIKLYRESKKDENQIQNVNISIEDAKKITISPKTPLDNGPNGTRYCVVIESGKFVYENEDSISGKTYYFTTLKEGAKWCKTCQADDHNTKDAHCTECGKYGHAANEHCENCGKYACEETTWCTKCNKHGHDYGPECPKYEIVCTRCGGKHDVSAHECEKCDELGHNTDAHECDLCLEIGHKTEEHKCSFCKEPGHEEKEENHCSDCKKYGHTAEDHCGCGVYGCDQGEWCETCTTHGHTKDDEHCTEHNKYNCEDEACSGPDIDPDSN